MRKKNLVSFVTLSVLLCASLRVGAAPEQKEQSAGERPLGGEDLLEISVFDIPQLNRTLRVSERGTISLPLLGEVWADGLTPQELEVRLRDLLEKKYLRDPQVSVFVKEHGSKRVSVLGAVGKPGVYEMLGQRNLLQVLSEAGGITSKVGEELFVIRSEPVGETDRIPIRIDELFSGRNSGANIEIRPGDIISVPLDRFVYVYVDGAVRNPGRLEELKSRPITLMQAIAKAGGTTDRAHLKGVQILRMGEDGQQEQLTANLKKIRRGKETDPVLREGDVVVVPETFF